MIQTPTVAGSDDHKQRFCRTFLDTHDPYDPNAITWPQLDAAEIERLRSLPFWDVAVETEGYASARIEALARIEPDPLLRDAVAMQGFEEARHKQLIEGMLKTYDISFEEPGEYRVSSDAEWGFMRMGYGECFDSFFAFGLFRLAKESGFFPAPLVEIFNPLVQEEARHILFFVNWAAYKNAQRPLWQRPAFTARRGAALAVQALSRLKLGKSAGSNQFASSGQQAVTASFDPRAFLSTCLEENDSRLGVYDASLLRPRIVPGLVRLALTLWPKREQAQGR
jgi:hypothetical protein